MENNLQDIFVPYEESLELKELGFNEECLGAWGEWGFMTPNDVSSLSDYIIQGDLDKRWIEEDNVCLAPTWEQAFKFFRDKYKIEGYPVCIKFNSKRLKGYQYVIISNNYLSFEQTGDFTSYEEARLECLKHLIKIVKDGTN